jgi:hypothetical protein
MIDRPTKELRASTVRSVNTCPYDDPGGNHLFPMTTYTVKIIYKDILHPGMPGASSLPCLTSSFKFRYHYLRWTSLIIHLAMFFASLTERTRHSYDILGREGGVMFCISYLHISIMQTANNFLRLGLLSRSVIWLSLKTERESMEHKALNHSPSLRLLRPFLHCRKANWLLKNHQKAIYVSWHRYWPSWISAMWHDLPNIQLYVNTIKRILLPKSIEDTEPIQNCE